METARLAPFLNSRRDEGVAAQSRMLAAQDVRSTDEVQVTPRLQPAYPLDHFEQFDHVLVTHPHAAVTRSRADFVLVFGAMNVDEAVARIRIVFVQSVEPQNTRRDQVLCRRRRFVG